MFTTPFLALHLLPATLACLPTECQGDPAQVEPPSHAPAVLATTPPGLVEIKTARVQIGTDTKLIRSMIAQSQNMELANETPSSQVKVEAFWLMTTELTNEQYREFVLATGARPLETWAQKVIQEAQSKFLEEEGRRARDAGPGYTKAKFDTSYWWENNWSGQAWELPKGLENTPAVNLSYEDAQRYARWAGLRLMTEFEYQLAARGTEERIYPWGNEWTPKKFAATNEQGQDRPFPVGSFAAGATESGIFDLVGNVWEWTSSPYAPYEDFKPLEIDLTRGKGSTKVTALPDFDRDKRVVVGGSISEGALAARISTRLGASRTQTTYALGARCASSAKPLLDLGEALLRTDLSGQQRPPDTDYDTSMMVGVDRWLCSAGTGGPANYKVIRDYDAIAFLPVKQTKASGVEHASELSVGENGPLQLGILTTSIELETPALPPGSYLVAWRDGVKPSAAKATPEESKPGKQKKDPSAGVSQSLQAGAAKPPPAPDSSGADQKLVYDPSVANLLITNAEGKLVAVLPAFELRHDRLRQAAARFVAKGELLDPQAAKAPKVDVSKLPKAPSDQLRLSLNLPSAASGRGLLFELVLVPPAGSLSSAWRSTAPPLN